MSRGPTGQSKLKELQAENTKLREGLSLNVAGYTLDMWLATGTDETRDEFAARALLAEYGNYPRALQRLGFNIISPSGEWKNAYVQMLAEKVFDTPGVKRRLDRTYESEEERWKTVMGRMAEVSKHGSDENAVRAAQLLAKIEGRFKQPDVVAPVASVSLHVLVNNQGNGKTEVEAIKTIEAHDPLAILGHEPSDIGAKIENPDLGELSK